MVCTNETQASHTGVELTDPALYCIIMIITSSCDMNWRAISSAGQSLTSAEEATRLEAFDGV